MPFSTRSGRGIVFNIQYFNVHDGPGIRTLVFFKGCPLSCRWCSNPESMHARPELALKRDLCNGCGRCIEVCPEKALFFNAEGCLNVDRLKCNACGRCVSVCPQEALTVYGKKVSAEEVFREVHRDKMFYEGSGGGVTASGGEPLQQPGFVAAVFRLCREVGIHTCLETCGYASARAWEQVLPLTDYVLFDLKHMDSRTHRDLTGKPNRSILANARMVAASGIPVMFHMPLVPCLNDDLGNIAATASFVNSLRVDNVQGMELMPYHRMGVGKYESLDRECLTRELKPLDAGDVESVRHAFEDMGVRCTVSR